MGGMGLRSPPTTSSINHGQAEILYMKKVIGLLMTLEGELKAISLFASNEVTLNKECVIMM